MKGLIKEPFFFIPATVELAITIWYYDNQYWWVGLIATAYFLYRTTKKL